MNGLALSFMITVIPLVAVVGALLSFQGFKTGDRKKFKAGFAIGALSFFMTGALVVTMFVEIMNMN